MNIEQLAARMGSEWELIESNPGVCEWAAGDLRFGAILGDEGEILVVHIIVEDTETTHTMGIGELPVEGQVTPDVVQGIVDSFGPVEYFDAPQPIPGARPGTITRDSLEDALRASGIEFEEGATSVGTPKLIGFAGGAHLHCYLEADGSCRDIAITDATEYGPYERDLDILMAQETAPVLAVDLPEVITPAWIEEQFARARNGGQPVY